MTKYDLPQSGFCQFPPFYFYHDDGLASTQRCHSKNDTFVCYNDGLETSQLSHSENDTSVCYDNDLTTSQLSHSENDTFVCYNDGLTTFSSITETVTLFSL